MPRVTKPVAERRREIITTARSLFTERGFEQTQIADISRQMQTAQGLIYHYFKSKTDLLYAVIDEMASEYTTTAEQALRSDDGSARESLEAFLRRQAPPPEAAFIADLANDPGVADYCKKKLTVSTLPLLTWLIERGNGDGSWECTYPRQTAIFILQGFSGLAELPPDERPEPRTFLTMIFRILGVDLRESAHE